MNRLPLCGAGGGAREEGGCEALRQRLARPQLRRYLQLAEGLCRRVGMGAVVSQSEKELNEMTDTLQALAGQTRSFVQRQFEAAEREVVSKLKESEPALGALAGAGVLGIFALASSYRLSTRLIEKVLPPVPAAMLATAGFGAGAGWCAVVAVRALRQAPAPLPTETLAEATDKIEKVAASETP